MAYGKGLLCGNVVTSHGHGYRSVPAGYSIFHVRDSGLISLGPCTVAPRTERRKMWKPGVNLGLTAYRTMLLSYSTFPGFLIWRRPAWPSWQEDWGITHEELDTSPSFSPHHPPPSIPSGCQAGSQKAGWGAGRVFSPFIISGFVPKDTLISWEWIFPKFCIENILFGLCLSVSNWTVLRAYCH